MEKIMKKPILHIPSVISQSCFTDEKGEVVDLLESEINYFYLLLFLYREKLLQQTPNLLLRDGDKYYFNEMIKYNSVEIELIEFQKYGVVSNHKYKKLTTFINNLSKLFININLLMKNKDRGYDVIDIIENPSFNSTTLSINFTKKFIKEIIHTDKFFMDVDLTNLFKLDGRKSKLLYLILKDYSKVGNKNLSNDDLMIIIGKIPQKIIFDETILQINQLEDIKVSYTVDGYRKKIYQFKINHKVNIKSTSKPKEEIDIDVMEKSKKKLQQMKDKGKKFDNEEGYLKTIYQNEIEKYKPKPPKKKSEDDLKVEEWIQTEILKLKNNNSIQFNHNNYLVIELNGNEFFIDDDYKIYNRMDFEKQNPKTSSSELTLRFFELYSDEISTNVFCGYGNYLKDKTLTHIKRD